MPTSDTTQASSTGTSSYDPQRSGNWQHTQNKTESPEAAFSPQAQVVIANFGQTSQNSQCDIQAAAIAAHQQQQRGVSQLTNAVGLLGQPPRNVQTPPPGGQTSTINGPLGTEKRGPVEFNHAISYVNKIKVCITPLTCKFLYSSK